MRTKLKLFILVTALLSCLYYSYEVAVNLIPHNEKIAVQGQIDLDDVGIFVYNPIFHFMNRITPKNILAFSPAWSPNGETIAFLLTDQTRNTFDLASINLANRKIDTYPNSTPIGGKIFQKTSISWSPDGENILYNAISAEGCNLFYIYNINAEKIIPLNISFCNRKNNHQIKRIVISWSYGETPIIGINYLGFSSNLDEIYILNKSLTEATYIVNGSNPLWIRNKNSFSYICWNEAGDMAPSICEYTSATNIQELYKLNYGQNAFAWESDGQSLLYIEEKGESDPLYLSRVIISSGEISHLYLLQSINFYPFPVVEKWIEGMVITSSGE